MNKETFEGKWNTLKGKAKEKWGKLTDDDLMKINGKKEQLVGHLQQKYGYLKEKAEEEVSNWETSCGSCGCSQDHHRHEEDKLHHGNNSHHHHDHHADNKKH